MACHQYFCCSLWVAFRLLKHRELICVDTLIFVHRGFDMPAREISAIGPRKCSRTKAADRSTLPIAVVDISRISSHTGILEGESQGAAPRCLGDFVRAHDGRREDCDRTPCQ